MSEDSLEKMNNSDSFHLRYLGKVQIKGKKEPLGIYECYDGDMPEIVEQKLKTKHDFEKGLKYFFAQDFPEASVAFNQVLKTNPADQTARLFLNKSSSYTIEGVPDDWTGVEIMTFK